MTGEEPSAVDKAKQSAAREAHQRSICDSSVFIIANGNYGSGLLFESRSGLPLILTARHIAEDLQRHEPLLGRLGPLHAMKSSVRALAFAPSRPSQHHDDGKQNDVDVAVFLPALENDSLSGAPRLSLGRIATELTQKDTDVVLLTGHPTFLLTPEATARFDSEVGHITYATGIAGRDRYGRLKVNWENAVRATDSPHPLHFPMPEGETVKLGAPNGISGGGLWRLFGPPENSKVWSPENSSHLLGVPCSWDSINMQYVEPVEFWQAWLHETAQRFDSEFA